MKHIELEKVHRSDASSEVKLEASIEAFQHYMNTYKRSTCGGHSRVFVDDVLYMLGVSLDANEYRMGNGFSKFKSDLAISLEKGGTQTLKCSWDEVS